MQHSFNTEIATKFGIEEAILLENIYFWTEKNRANEKHFYNGRYWTYNSVRAFKEQFPYMTQRTISRKLQNLIDEGLILTENYNENKYDRTLWYALTDYAYSIMPKCQMEDTKMANGNDKNGEPIPYIKPNINSNKDRVKFTPPTLEEVKEYAKSKQRFDLAEKFYNYFTEGKWTDSKGNKVKNWKQKFLTWCSYGNQIKDKNFKSRQYEEKELNALFSNIDDIEV